MKSTFDIEDRVYQHIANSSFKQLISGGIYKGQDSRPVNSTREDVVIIALATNNLQLQSALVNVNIHVKNKVVTVEGVNTEMMDHSRLKTLTAQALKLLREVWGDGDFSVQQQIPFKETGSSYTNIRLEYYSINDETY